MITEYRQTEMPDVESASRDYATRFAGPTGQYFLEIQSRHLLDLIRPWTGARVLDVGGGHAQLAVPLVAAGYDVTVTGSTPACRELLDERLAPDEFEYHVCPLLELPYEDNSFDVVTSFRILPHLRQWSEFLKELCRVARYAVLVDYPERRSVNRFAQGLFAAKKAVERNTRPFQCFQHEELAEVLDQCGFAGREVRPQFFFPMVIHRALKRPGLSRGLETGAASLGLTRKFGSPVILLAHTESRRSDSEEVEGSS